MKIKYTIIFIGLLMLSCSDNTKKDKPNVILIMADDMGYECLSCYGSTSYQTPNLDKLASDGIVFTQCVSQPLCTPSRVKIMTGLRNYRNYEYFGYLNPNQYTFGNMMKEAGYETCIAGKWQLNGLYFKDKTPDWNDKNRPNHFGFDEYCLWQLTERGGGKRERYANPLIDQNRELLDQNIDDYGPDIFTNYILDFIERKKDKPFFIYYPMVLVHDPFVPTPDSKNWKNRNARYKQDTAYFRDMVEYTDKITGRITDKLKELKIEDNTIVIFTGDNGTNTRITSHTHNGVVQGGKGNTIDAGTHVPLIISWPQKVQEGFIYNNLIEFSDFFPTLAQLIGKDVKSDGKSFLGIITGVNHTPRKTAFVYYDPQWGKSVNKYRNVFVRTLNYKLYQDGSFFNLNYDILEKEPLNPDSLTKDEIVIKTMLEKELNKHPTLKTN